ncbi:hypothetical protein LX32DRAFT_456616 [Colletotrichum zoysiae]|uniref:Uncharacterized protein n=1 Tax=Colletotrichum zoysiae TaxID=1216348 RepID=A0AAD9M2Q9_9PEZI|nr:hypothetical protein LX32DRAFT_456616 [Colletotrichum zoysiae]
MKETGIFCYRPGGFQWPPLWICCVFTPDQLLCPRSSTDGSTGVKVYGQKSEVMEPREPHPASLPCSVRGIGRVCYSPPAPALSCKGPLPCVRVTNTEPTFFMTAVATSQDCYLNAKSRARADDTKGLRLPVLVPPIPLVFVSLATSKCQAEEAFVTSNEISTWCVFNYPVPSQSTGGWLGRSVAGTHVAGNKTPTNGNQKPVTSGLLREGIEACFLRGFAHQGCHIRRNPICMGTVEIF